MGVMYVGVVRILKHLKEEPAQAAGKRLHVISNIMQYITKELKRKVVSKLKQYCMCC